MSPMNHDQIFRAVLIVVFLVVLPIGIYHRLKSQATGEKLDRRQEGLFILATLRPMGAAFWLGLIAWMVELVLHGPYRWIRHPLYDSAALLTVAISLIAANWFLFLTGVALFCLLTIRTRTEEQNLLARFGNGYQTYMERTGRFLPRIGPKRRGA